MPLISVTDYDGEEEFAARLELDELDRLIDALATVALASSARLVAVLRHARKRGNPLVLAAQEGPSQEDEEQALARANALIETMSPPLDIPSDATAVLARRNAQRRTELLREFGAFDAEQIAAGRSRAANRHALAARWRKEGRIFGVAYLGQTLHPAFQFDEQGALRPVIAEVLHALPRDELSEWETALWWTAANGSLGGRRPVDLLDEEPQALVEAARTLAEPLPL